MEIRYFTDTDTLLIDFSHGEIVETKDIDENTLVEFDGNGGLVSMTIEHAKSRIDVDSLSFHRFAEQRLLKDAPGRCSWRVDSRHCTDYRGCREGRSNVSRRLTVNVRCYCYSVQ